MLVSLERDMYVLMAELATAPENRAKLTPGSRACQPGHGRSARAAHRRPDDALRAARGVRASPVRTGSPRYLDLGRTVVRRAERAALSAAPPPSLVVPYLNRLSDLLWTMARWQEGEALPAKST